MAVTAEQLADKLLDAANELMTLQIVTTVGDLAIAVDGTGQKLTFSTLAATASAITRINAVTGDIWTNRTQNTMGGENAAIADYHERMVEKSQAIIERNLRVIADLVERLKVAG